MSHDKNNRFNSEKKDNLLEFKKEINDGLDQLIERSRNEQKKCLQEPIEPDEIATKIKRIGLIIEKIKDSKEEIKDC